MEQRIYCTEIVIDSKSQSNVAEWKPRFFMYKTKPTAWLGNYLTIPSVDSLEGKTAVTVRFGKNLFE